MSSSPPILSLAEYRTLKPVKRLSGGLQSGQIALLPHNIVRKTYKKLQQKYFANEVTHIARLHSGGCPFIPQLLAVDEANLTLYMSYCGPTVKRLAPHQKQLQQFQKILKDSYGVYHNDLRPENVCQNPKTKKLYLIDFGWARFYKPGLAGHGLGKLGHPSQTAADLISGKTIRTWLAQVRDNPQNRISKSDINRLNELTGWRL